MGQAKIRKKNGTYPTPEQIAQWERERERENMEWFPTADDLPLLHIPENVRPALRERLRPWLTRMTHLGGNTKRVGIKRGECWRVAQSLVLTASDPGVKYVEGFWGHGSSHGWTMVDGYRIDLIQEFYTWRDKDRKEPVYEPFQEFTHEELRIALEDENGYDDKILAFFERQNDRPSFGIVHQRWLDEGNITEHRCHDFTDCCRCLNRSVMCSAWEDCECECEAAMRSAFERIVARRSQAEEVAA